MKAQAGIVIALLTVLAVTSVMAEIRAYNQGAEATPAAQTEFSVTSIAEGQYVMRANDKIFYCVGNRCTGIQLVAAPQPAAQAAPAPEESNQ